MRIATLGAKMYRTNIKDVPKVEGLKRDDGWIDMQVQLLIDKKSAGADHVERAVRREERLLLEAEREGRRDREGRGGEEGAERAGAPHQALRLIMPIKLI